MAIADGKSLKARRKDGSTVDIKHAAKFLRWLEFDPATAVRRTFAYPIDGSLYEKGRTGAAKIGDIVALGGGKFLAIEQGARAGDGVIQNWLMRITIEPGTTDISNFDHALEVSSIAGEPVAGADYNGVIALRKERILDLNALGWAQGKAEGLAVVDDHTIAIINDNDFGLSSELRDASDQTLRGSIEDCTLDASTARLSGCTSGEAHHGELVIVDRKASVIDLWLIRFDTLLDRATSF
ncbi:MAG: hypothetical protein EBR51_04125 [Gammaproteobacteria bacterium]|nr:hypothetical protein [Gammaproteobacteria bacterium]